MKTIGLIGGMSWESTVSYYQIINEEVKRRLGGLHSAKVILYSVEFDEIEKCQSDGDWKKSGDILGKAAKSIEAAGADFILICTNTMHKVVPQIESMIQIPIIHIADATAQELLACQIRKVGLLGTKYTMTQDFYKQRLIDRGIDVITPTCPPPRWSAGSRPAPGGDPGFPLARDFHPVSFLPPSHFRRD